MKKEIYNGGRIGDFPSGVTADQIAKYNGAIYEELKQVMKVRKEAKMEDKPLSQNEAKLAADFLKKNGHPLKSGYVTVWRVRPSEIAQVYKISLPALLVALRRGPK